MAAASRENSGMSRQPHSMRQRLLSLTPLRMTSKRPYSPYIDPNAPSSTGTSSKKARSEPDTALWDMITRLPTETTHALLFNICTSTPSASAIVQAAYVEHFAKLARKPPVDFDFLSKNCWYALNKQYARLSSSRQCDMVGDIMSTLSEAREQVLKEAGEGERWETRRNGLEVLRKISKSIMLCEQQQIQHELMKTGEELGAFSDTMIEIAGAMTEQERARYVAEGLYEKLVELQTHCEWETDMEGLRELYEIFDGPGDGEEEVEGENEDLGEREGDDDSEDIGETAEMSEFGDGGGGEYFRDLPESEPVLRPTPRRTSVFNVNELG